MRLSELILLLFSVVFICLVKFLDRRLSKGSFFYSVFYILRKRYEKAEKEFVAAKLNLFQKMENKEQLTEHLCSLIEQNEIRKSDKLADLMDQLEMEVVTNSPDKKNMSPVRVSLIFKSFQIFGPVVPAILLIRSKVTKTL